MNLSFRATRWIFSLAAERDYVASALLAVLLVTGAAQAQEFWQAVTTSPSVDALQQELKNGSRDAADRFWASAAKRTTPLVDGVPADPKHVFVTFLWKQVETSPVPSLLAQLIGDRTLHQVQGTDVWFKAYRMPADYRFSYSFGFGASGESLFGGKPDPLNPHSLPPVGSYLEMSAAPPQAWIKPKPGVAKGTVSYQQLESPTLKNHHPLWTYVPAGYDPKGKPYPLLIFFFGSMYVKDMSATVTLDNLIAARRIPPVVAVFIEDPPGEGNQELRNHRSFLTFITDEVMPWIRKQWNVTHDPAQTTLCGASAAGLVSGYLAMNRPDLFGNVIAQSGAFWRGNEGDEETFEYVTTELRSRPKMQIRFVLQPGQLEQLSTPSGGAGPSILTANRNLRDVLRTKGYEVDYTEEPGGHEPLTWRGTIADGLITIFSGNK